MIVVCMFIVSKALLISSTRVIVRAGRAIWLNPFATVLFNVCSTRVAWVCLICLLLCKEGSSRVYVITERRDMGLYEVLLSMSLLGFGMGTMLSNFHICGML